MNFTDFFANTPLCCPSRVELMDGRCGLNNLVEIPSAASCMHANITGPFFAQNQLGAYLLALEYTTGLFGKYFNGNHHPWPCVHVPVRVGVRWPAGSGKLAFLEPSFYQIRDDDVADQSGKKL